MLVAFSGWLANYDGSFDFESGSEYPDGLNYQSMRIFNATWGALMVPIAYLTARQFHMSTEASTLAATMVLADTAYLCISRFILLDSMLLFFTCTSLYCLAAFHNQRKRAFSASWWLWLSLTGVSLGCVLSVKWVGLFAVALVGFDTIEELWEMFGNLQMPKRTYATHWIARILSLICIPGIIYVTCFSIHFSLLYKSGSGDTTMSSVFQARLVGNSLRDNPVELADGSNVTLKNNGYGGALLHSHIQTYPEGSQQQQVTCYHHKDINNNWIVQVPRYRNEANYENADHVRLIKDGDIIRLMHLQTGNHLRSHPIDAPVSANQWEVSAHRNESIEDQGDLWKVEVAMDSRHKHIDHVRSLTTRFRLRHLELGCLLAADNAVLPQWGFRQIEVVCNKNNQTHDESTWWNVEEHVNHKLPPPPKDAYSSSFWTDFLNLNSVMWVSNNALIADPEKDDVLTSEPLEWPMISVGLRMCGWEDEQVKFYLLGNPAVWWPAFLSLWVFVTSALVHTVRSRRQLACMPQDQWNEYFRVGKTLFMGWLLHYVPFFVMGRVTYLHHYFPALYFSILMVPLLLDHITVKMASRTRSIVFVAAFFVVISVFIYFSPLAYGMEGPIQGFAGRRWLKKWNMLDTL